MVGANDRPAGNRLLARLGPADADRLLGHLEPVELRRKQVIAAAHEPWTHAYFLDEGIASLVVPSPDGAAVEAGVIGREGFLIPALALGSDRIPHPCEIQVPGFGQRMPMESFKAFVASCPPLRDLCLLFAQAMIVQTAGTAYSNAYHPVNERLARWLLMCHDRSSSDDLALTHEYMAVMLCVRRPSVTDALHVLQGEALIRNDRGFVQIVNRGGLEAFAGAAYGAPEAEYRRLIGAM